VTDHDAIEAMGLSKKRIMELVVQASATQIFIHGDVHADPHPGLLLVPGWPDVVEIRRAGTWQSTSILMLCISGWLDIVDCSHTRVQFLC
jgi:hypothetical protein